MRSRGGIPSFFPILAIFVAVLMAFPLDIGVTGQYLCGVTGQYHKTLPLSSSFLPRAEGTPRRKDRDYEEESILLVAPAAWVAPVRWHRRAVRRARGRIPAY